MARTPIPSKVQTDLDARAAEHAQSEREKQEQKEALWRLAAVFNNDPNRLQIKDNMISVLMVLTERVCLLRKIQKRTHAATPSMVITLQGVSDVEKRMSKFLQGNQSEISKLEKQLNVIERKKSSQMQKLMDAFLKTPLKSKKREGLMDLASILAPALQGFGKGFYGIDHGNINRRLMAAEAQLEGALHEYNFLLSVARSHQGIETKKDTKILDGLRAQLTTLDSAVHAAWDNKVHPLSSTPARIEVSRNKSPRGRSDFLEWTSFTSNSTKEMPDRFDSKYLTRAIVTALSKCENGEKAFHAIMKQVAHYAGKEAKLQGFSVQHRQGDPAEFRTLVAIATLKDTHSGKERRFSIALPCKTLDKILLVDKQGTKVDATRVIRSAMERAVVNQLTFSHHATVVHTDMPVPDNRVRMTTAKYPNR